MLIEKVLRAVRRQPVGSAPLIGAMIVGGIATACIDRPVPTESVSPTPRFTIVAQTSARGADARALKIDVGYLRTNGTSQSMTTWQAPLASAPAQISVSVDLAPCLSDSLHVGTSRDCTIQVTAML